MIKFYSKSKTFSELSNFELFENFLLIQTGVIPKNSPDLDNIPIDSHVIFPYNCFLYKSIEHFYQSMKTLDNFERIKILESKTPQEARHLGKNIKVRKEWKFIKNRIMWEGLLTKFNLPKYKDILLSTCGHELVHWSPWDKYWGVDNNGNGKNILGKMLMRIRDYKAPMNTIIAGSRSITNYEIVKNAINESRINISTVVSGCARGVDNLGEEWANKNNIPIHRFPANWDKYGKSAGIIRNKEMAKFADAAIIIYDGKSKGSINMINNAKKYGLKLFVKKIV